MVSEFAPVPVAATGETLVSVRGLGKTFRGRFGRKPTIALRDVSFSIAAGEFVGVVDESGSGKSTLACLLMGFEHKTTSDIHLAGQDVGRWNAAARRLRLRTAQMVFQDPQSALNPRRRVGAIVI
ncbi:MAG: ATP-binding cassette domain-containing protein [Acetobacteraceae bacterium]|nr:ATP-binding cassette domain-containing protein [Acetobacteraceae bacterium]